MTAEPSTERTADDEPFAWSIVEHPPMLEGANAVRVQEWVTYSVRGPDGLICSGIPTQQLAEDIASLPILQRELDRLRLVPVRRSEDDRLESVCQLLVELLAEVRRSNAVERTGAVSSVQIEDAAKGPPRLTTKRYTGSEPEVDEAIADHARAKAAANERWLTDWQSTVEALKA